MLINNKSIIKTTSYASALFISFISISYASIVSVADLEGTKKSLSPPIERKPEMTSQGPRRVSMITPEDITNFKKNAREVQAGHSNTRESITPKSVFLKEIHSSQNLVNFTSRHFNVDHVLISWSEYLSNDSSPALQEIRRDAYIAEHLVRLSHPGHVAIPQDSAYDITIEDVGRIQCLTDEKGGKGAVEDYFHQQAQAISFQTRSQKEALKTSHHAVMACFLEAFSNWQDLFQLRKENYAEGYKGSLWDQAIIKAYTAQKFITLDELRRLGMWLQSDEVDYAIEDNADLEQWMAYWRPFLEGDYQHNRIRGGVIQTFEEQKKSDSLFMKSFLQQAHHQHSTLVNMVEKINRNVLPLEYLKTLMAKKHPLLVQLKKLSESPQTLTEQVLHPPKDFAPNFVSDLFISMAESTTPGTFYNTYHTTLGILGKTGYVMVDENGDTSRAYYVLQKDKTIFSETKTDSDLLY